MKTIERQKARRLRQKGVAIGVIADRLGVAKSSVSTWVRDVVLPTAVLQKLKQNSHTRSAIEKRRSARLAQTAARRAVVRSEAIAEVPDLSQDPLWYVGVSLYWGEGGKTQQIVRISNSDPVVIQTMMRFFRTLCSVSEKDFRGQVHVFAHTNKTAAEQYWSQVSEISRNQFYKTYAKKSSASKNKRNTLPYGTFQVSINNTNLFIRVLAWIDYVKKSTI